LGVRAVKIKIGYPILVPAFPRSADYLQLFKRLGQELKTRNLKFLVQTTSTFTEPAFSSVPVGSYYANLIKSWYWVRPGFTKHATASLAALLSLPLHRSSLAMSSASGNHSMLNSSKC
jgi:hypothetical protein